mmetsp:Transcript_40116/g.52814  ORF Transcript_40116/g.52814 Transcript_40116/m.52814 type:complete len:374 (-) Transcript_40116:450-1571(-)
MATSNRPINAFKNEKRQESFPLDHVLDIPTNEEMEIAEKIVFSRTEHNFHSKNGSQPLLHMTAAGQAAADDLKLPMSCNSSNLTFPGRLIKFGRALAQDPRILEAIQDQGQFKAFYENQIRKRQALHQRTEQKEEDLLEEKLNDEDELWTHLESLDDQDTDDIPERKLSLDAGESHWDSSSFIKVGRALIEEDYHCGSEDSTARIRRKNKSGWELVLEDHQCAICKGLIVGAAVVDCPRGHCYCGPCLGKWLEYERSCPLCTAPVSQAHPVWNIDKIIEKTVHELDICPEKIDWLERREHWKMQQSEVSLAQNNTEGFGNTPFLSEHEEEDVGNEDEGPLEQHFHTALAVASLLFAAVVLIRCKAIPLPFRYF